MICPALPAIVLTSLGFWRTTGTQSTVVRLSFVEFSGVCRLIARQPIITKYNAGRTLGKASPIPGERRSVVAEPDDFDVFRVAAADVKQREARDVLVGLDTALGLNAERNVTEVGRGQCPDKLADRVRGYGAANDIARLKNFPPEKPSQAPGPLGPETVLPSLLSPNECKIRFDL
jgi:hypothetical protein